MARKKNTNKLIDRKDIPEELRPIEGSDDYYVSSTGDVYADYGNDFFLKKKQQTIFGYKYCGVKYKNKMITKRVHRLVASAFIVNPDPKSNTVVGHKNNNKSDNRVNNLYWTTVSENTKKAFQDGLAVNKKGIEDSQSIQVCSFDMSGNLLKTYGSISEASIDTGMTKSGITFQCKHRCVSKPKKSIYFRYKSEYDSSGFVL